MKMIKQAPDLNSFFENGYDTSTIDRSFIDHLAGYVFSEQFGSGTYPGVENPIWDRDYQDLDFNFYKSQEKYVDLIKDLLKQNYFKYWNEIYGNFSFFKVSINKMQPGSSMDWHWDGFDGTFIQLLFYLQPLQQGQFEVGIANKIQVKNTDSFPHWQPSKGLNYIGGDVKSTGKININNDTMIILNNQNPKFVHRVNETDQLRYSVIASCGYDHHWAYNKIKSYDIEE